MRSTINPKNTMAFIDEIAPVMPERPWTQDAPAETQPHSSLPVSADEEYADAHEIFESGHAQFDAALTGSLNYLLAAALGIKADKPIAKPAP